mmetsp:Transcript_93260/g.252976  ORF Transcript_93260/g.252976 Transcript_93260/m.252976 type:complete len:584 (-) Transcript_93260:72-1823(-)
MSMRSSLAVLRREKTTDLAVKYPGRLSNQYAKPDNMSMEVLLQRYNLGEYYQFFDTAKYSMIDISGKFNDQTVEYILSDVEKRNGIRFKSDVRVRLWKALRHIWMHGMRERPKHVRDADVPQVFLPKKDYRQVDSIVKLGDLEPDRQRQIIRKTKPAISSGRGPGIHVMQFEVYRRQIDMWYEFKDLQRCVIEWQRKNPRTMLQEDPREEVMKLRIRDMIHRSDHEAKLATERGKGQFYTWVCLVGIQLVMGSLSALMCLVTYMAYRASPPTLYLEFMGGSKQLISAVSFLQAFTVAYVVIQRRRVNPMIKRYQDTSISCDRLMEQISDFRFETSPLRLAREEDQQKDDKYVPRRKKAPVGSLTDMVKRNGPKAAVPRHRSGKHKAKSKMDATLGKWLDNSAMDETAMKDKAILRKAIEESYERFPLPEEGIRRTGGNRMAQFEERLGGIDDEALVVVASKLDKGSHPRGILGERPSTSDGPGPRRAAAARLGGTTESSFSSRRVSVAGSTPPESSGAGATPLGATPPGATPPGLRSPGAASRTRRASPGRMSAFALPPDTPPDPEAPPLPPGFVDSPPPRPP